VQFGGVSLQAVHVLSAGFNRSTNRLQHGVIHKDIKPANVLANSASGQCWLMGFGTYWSKEHFRIFEYDPQTTKPSYSLFTERIHPEDRFSFEEIVNRAARDKSNFEYDYRIVLPDRSIKFLRSVGHALVNLSGELEFIGTVMDITDLKRVEEMRAAMAGERELFAQQRATELAKANEALRGCLDALASVPELDDFLGQVMAAITRHLGAVASALRVLNLKQNTLTLELLFQDGRVMSPPGAVPRPTTK
jgi:serine/threonine protein kinase